MSDSVHIDPTTEIGAVRLAVADLQRAQSFYEHVLGLSVVGRDADATRLGADGEPLVELVAASHAEPVGRGTTGLFHFALLMPDRLELGRAARRLSDAGWPLSGVADHLVSEALYLNDPEGNGIELYRDRPRAEWRYEAGELEMATLPLDLGGLIDGAAGELDPKAAPATRMGHIHLKVGELSSAEAFYADALGFEPTTRAYNGALFLSAGGYHHHIGLNVWASRGGAAPAVGAPGMRWFEIVLADSAQLELCTERFRRAGFNPESRGERIHLTDPSGIGLVLRSRHDGAG